MYAASLLDQPAHRRYTLHDLVAAYAATLAADLPEPDRQAALDRLYDHYAATSTQAMNLAYPWEADQRPRPPATHTPAPTLTGEHEAQTWLDTETDNLLAAAHHAATGHRADHTLHQSATLRRHLRTRGHYNRAALLHQQALTAPTTPATSPPHRTRCSLSATPTTGRAGTGPPSSLSSRPWPAPAGPATTPPNRTR